MRTIEEITAMKQMFDDHVEVTVKRSGDVETEYYEHE